MLSVGGGIQPEQVCEAKYEYEDGCKGHYLLTGSFLLTLEAVFSAAIAPRPLKGDVAAHNSTKAMRSNARIRQIADANIQLIKALR